MHLYIHIPFCNQKCRYCDFVSGVYSRGYQEDYIRALTRELESVFENVEPRAITTLYIGGGTPSSLAPEALIQIYETLERHMDLSSLEEFTVEANPESVTFDFALLAAANGVNRISLGVQSANADELEFLGRIHSFEQVEEAVKLFRKVGIHNINMDLIFALPDQSLKNLSYSLKRFAEIEPEHISCYSLIFEEGTALTKLLDLGMISEIDEDYYVKQYRYIIDYLQDKGYQQYEISNFAKKGYESKHNSSYWSGDDYIGVGTAAHSKIGNKRFSNVSDIEEYIQRFLNSDGFLQAIDEESIEFLDAKDVYNELIFLGLRRSRGIDLSDLTKHIDALKYSSSFSNFLDIDEVHLTVYRAIKQLVEDGLLHITDKKISLTQRGREISNTVFTKLMI